MRRWPASPLDEGETLNLLFFFSLACYFFIVRPAMETSTLRR